MPLPPITCICVSPHYAYIFSDRFLSAARGFMPFYYIYFHKSETYLPRKQKHMSLEQRHIMAHDYYFLFCMMPRQTYMNNTGTYIVTY